MNEIAQRRHSSETIEAINYLAYAIARNVVKLLGKPTELVDTDEMAEKLKVSRSTIERLASKGDIPKIKVGDTARYSPTDVIEALSKKGERQND
jgi:excisionase family DNA binding protein